MQAIAGDALQAELEAVLARPQGQTLASILATLVAIGTLELRVAVRRDGRGIFHHKIGIFTDDEGDSISFVGSTNETWAGWNPEGNDESFEVFKSWTDAERVARHRDFFENVWEGHEPGIETFSLPEAVRRSLIRHSSPQGLDGLPSDPVLTGLPSVPLFSHQDDALRDWIEHGRRGLLEHSTGSGKTITALAAIRMWLLEGKPCLVVVPSELLLRQWLHESRRLLGDLDPPILLAGGGHGPREWEPALHAFTAPGEGPRLAIATLQTASTTRFVSRIADPSEVLLVIDEAHRAGSPQFRRLFALAAPARLGLSATPERAGDEAGTEAIFRFFTRKIDPVFTLADAVAAGRLTPYRYHLHWLELTEAEQRRWDAVTRTISQEYAKLKDGEPASDYLKRLLIKRAAIVKAASGKVVLAERVMRDQFRAGQAWLVYCDSQVQLNQVLRKLRDAGLPSFEYHSAMQGDRSATMSYFIANGGVLVAIRCLDEGVDIPRISHALILASSRNAREFIQRRGRVLRRYSGKHHAEIHDALVRPYGETAAESDGRILGPEIARALLFAQDAMNRAPEAELQAEVARLGLDPSEVASAGVEADE